MRSVFSFTIYVLVFFITSSDRTNVLGSKKSCRQPLSQPPRPSRRASPPHSMSPNVEEEEGIDDDGCSLMFLVFYLVLCD